MVTRRSIFFFAAFLIVCSVLLFIIGTTSNSKSHVIKDAVADIKVAEDVAVVKKTSPDIKVAIKTLEKPPFVNRLASSSSPYLKQHAHNPVDWYPWGDEALQRAKQEGKLIILSIGYSTCYWCHVMERTVFEDVGVAELMNKHFINIKVDNEERPDLDRIYMMASNILRGRGGWPNNLLLTPDLKPFYAASYMPKESWVNMLKKTANDWKDPDKKKILGLHANKITMALRHHFDRQQKNSVVTRPAARLAQDYANNLGTIFDNYYGGFGSGMKFMRETALHFLFDKAQIDNDKAILHIIQHTVDNILSGGIYDHVGGGFHRYATDRKWRVPHFEKMLYNQANMISILANLYELTGNVAYKSAITQTAEYVARRMTDDNGAFYTAMDAETDGVEGEYYVWNENQLKETLGEDDFALMMTAYNLEALPHHSNHKSTKGSVVFKPRKQDEADWFLTANIRAKLLNTRQKRKSPRIDNKIIVAWNGMMIDAYASSGHILGKQDYIARAEKAARFILDNMLDEQGSLYRIYADNKAYQRGFLEDYAWLAKGLISLYKVTHDTIYKDEAKRLINQIDKEFMDKENGGYFFSDEKDGQLTRIKTGSDAGVLPSANSVMAHVFIDFYEATNEMSWLDRADQIFSFFSDGITSNPSHYGHMVHALMRKEQLAATVPHDAPSNSKKEEEKIVNKPTLSSIDKVNITARIISDIIISTEKSIFVTLITDKGWHVNANPASKDFLIPISLYIQTDVNSKINVIYPEAEVLETPLGSIDVYSGYFEIEGIINTDNEINPENISVLLQFQACNKFNCLAPSQIALKTIIK